MDNQKYFIGQSIFEVRNDIEEVSKGEYKYLRPLFRDEKIYHANSMDFCGMIWASVLGITNDKVYKISYLTEHQNPLTCQCMFPLVASKISKQYSCADENIKDGDNEVSSWRLNEGNIYLHSFIYPESISSLTITITGSEPFKNPVISLKESGSNKRLIVNIVLVVIGLFIIINGSSNYIQTFVGLMFIISGLTNAAGKLFNIK